MKRILAILAVALLAAPAAAQNPPPAQPSLSLEQQTLLRCSAAFAIVADEQQRGVASARAYPPLAQRGREYFVRAAARLMDELSWSREQIEARLRGEVHALRSMAGEATNPSMIIDSVMQPCLISLGASGL